MEKQQYFIVSLLIGTWWYRKWKENFSLLAKCHDFLIMYSKPPWGMTAQNTPGSAEQPPGQMSWEPEGTADGSHTTPHHTTACPACTTSCSHIPVPCLRPLLSTQLCPLQFSVLDSTWMSARERQNKTHKRNWKSLTRSPSSKY